MTLPVALVGLGGVAQTYVAAVLAGNTGINVRAVIEPDDVRRRSAADALDAVGFDSLDAFLADPAMSETPAVAVCTPPSSHEELVITAVRAGKHVLCEKPLALNSPSLHRMFEAADANDRLLMMASKFRYVNDVVATREMILAGDLGETVLFRNAFTSRVNMGSRWNGRLDLAGGGVIMDNGTHSVDIARFLAGKIVTVTAITTLPIQSLEVEDSAQMLFRTQTGVCGSIDLSWSLASGSEWYVTIDGSKASVRLGWHTAEINRGTGWTSFGSGYHKITAFSNNLSDFANAVVHGTTPRINRADIHASVAVIDAAYRSVRSKAWANVDERREMAPLA